MVLDWGLNLGPLPFEVSTLPPGSRPGSIILLVCLCRYQQFIFVFEMLQTLKNITITDILPFGRELTDFHLEEN